MKPENVWNEFEQLPRDAQRQGIDFIAFLRTRHQSRKPAQKTMSQLISREPFIGMWSDREEMKESTEWVRRQREQDTFRTE